MSLARVTMISLWVSFKCDSDSVISLKLLAEIIKLRISVLCLTGERTICGRSNHLPTHLVSWMVIVSSLKFLLPGLRFAGFALRPKLIVSITYQGSWPLHGFRIRSTGKVYSWPYPYIGLAQSAFIRNLGLWFLISSFQISEWGSWPQLVLLPLLLNEFRSWVLFFPIVVCSLPLVVLSQCTGSWFRFVFRKPWLSANIVLGLSYHPVQ